MVRELTLPGRTARQFPYSASHTPRPPEHNHPANHSHTRLKLPKPPTKLATGRCTHKDHAKFTRSTTLNTAFSYLALASSAMDCKHTQLDRIKQGIRELTKGTQPMLPDPIRQRTLANPSAVPVCVPKKMVTRARPSSTSASILTGGGRDCAATCLVGAPLSDRNQKARMRSPATSAAAVAANAASGSPPAAAASSGGRTDAAHDLAASMARSLPPRPRGFGWGGGDDIGEGRWWWGACTY
jgi:hypothetical protein